MGLAGRKVKQRIGPDPRNLTWADDASKFGANYLAKFGWDSSKGLGAEGQGRTSHIKVSQKLDMLGIGAAQSKDPNGIAWKQNKDFESLLKRLNEKGPNTENVEESKEDVDMNEDNSKEERKKRKREEKERKKQAKKRKREESEDKDEEQKTKIAEEVVEVKQVIIPQRRAHRARAIAAKSISSKSAASISEVLGIAPSSSSTPTPSTVTPSATPTLDQDLGLHKLSTSTKSVADYFKERLLAKASGKSTPLSSVTTPDDEGEKELRHGRVSASDDDFDDAPRGGLGSTRATFTSTTSSSQMAKSKFASMFTSATKEETCDESEVKAKEERRHEKAEKKEKKRRSKEAGGSD